MSNDKPVPDCDMPKEMQEKYISDGFAPEDIPRIWADTLYFRRQMREKREPREITCTAYKNAVKQTEKQVGQWLSEKVRS